MSDRYRLRRCCLEQNSASGKPFERPGHAKVISGGPRRLEGRRVSCCGVLDAPREQAVVRLPLGDAACARMSLVSARMECRWFGVGSLGVLRDIGSDGIALWEEECLEMMDVISFRAE